MADIKIIDSGIHTLIRFSNVEIALMNVDHRLIGSDDFLFV